MSLVRLAVGFALLALGCQGEYPIEPTACDEWCDATRGFGCGFYDPAACVSQCEADGLSREGPCRVRFDAALACIRNTPGAATWQCSFVSSGAQPCQSELQSLYDCTLN